MEKTTDKNRFRLAIAIAILLLSIIGNGIFFSFQSGLKNEKNIALLSRDSLLSVKLLVDKELDKAKGSLLECEGKNDNLNVEISRLNKEIEEKNLQVAKLVKDNASLNALRNKLKEAQKLRDDCEKLVADYIKEKAKLEAENNTLRQSVNKLTQENDEYKKKIDKGKNLRAYDIAVLNYKVTKSKERPTIRARKTNRVAVSFTLAENSLAEAGSKSVYLVVYDTKKKVLGKSSDKFTNKKNNAEQAYSVLKATDFNNDDKKTTINYDTDSKLMKGKYKVEIYTDGNLSGTKEFELR